MPGAIIMKPVLLRGVSRVETHRWQLSGERQSEEEREREGEEMNEYGTILAIDY